MTTGAEPLAVPEAVPEAQPIEKEPFAAPVVPAIDNSIAVEAPWQCLHSSYITVERIAGAILWSVLLVVFLTAIVVTAVLAMIGFAWLGVLICLGTLAVLSGLGLLLWYWPLWSHQATRWRATDEGLEIKRGVWWRHHVYVPRQRIQHTDVVRGPLLRRFGLATLVINTAGTHNHEIKLEGLEVQQADSLRQDLLPKDYRGN